MATERECGGGVNLFGQWLWFSFFKDRTFFFFFVLTDPRRDIIPFFFFFFLNLPFEFPGIGESLLPLKLPLFCLYIYICFIRRHLGKRGNVCEDMGNKVKGENRARGL
jgi:hypothetical protein